MVLFDMVRIIITTDSHASDVLVKTLGNEKLFVIILITVCGCNSLPFVIFKWKLLSKYIKFPS